MFRAVRTQRSGLCFQRKRTVRFLLLSVSTSVDFHFGVLGFTKSPIGAILRNMGKQAIMAASTITRNHPFGIASPAYTARQAQSKVLLSFPKKYSNYECSDSDYEEPHISCLPHCHDSADKKQATEPVIIY